MSTSSSVVNSNHQRTSPLSSTTPNSNISPGKYGNNQLLNHSFDNLKLSPMSSSSSSSYSSDTDPERGGSGSKKSMNGAGVVGVGGTGNGSGSVGDYTAERVLNNLASGGSVISQDERGSHPHSGDSSKRSNKTFDFQTSAAQHLESRSEQLQGDSASASANQPGRSNAAPSAPADINPFTLTDDDLRELCGKASDQFQLHIVKGLELKTDKPLLDTLHSEGCAFCCRQGLAPETASKDVRFVELRCRLLQCKHISHLVCLLRSSSQHKAPSQGSGSMAVSKAPVLEAFHSTSFFHVVPITDQNKFQPMPPSSGGSRSHLNKRVYLEFGVTHYTSNAQLLHVVWPQSFSTSVDIVSGNEYIIVEVDGSAVAGSSHSAASVRSAIKHDYRRAVLTVSRGRLVFKCTDDATGHSLFHVCNYDISEEANKADTEASTYIHLVLVDTRSRNILTVGLMRLGSDDAHANGNSSVIASSEPQPVHTNGSGYKVAQYAVVFVRYEFCSNIPYQQSNYPNGVNTAHINPTTPVLTAPITSATNPNQQQPNSNPSINAKPSGNYDGNDGASVGSGGATNVMASPQFAPLLPSDLIGDNNPSASTSTSTSAALPSLNQMPSAGQLATAQFSNSNSNSNSANASSRTSPSSRNTGLQASATSFTPGGTHRQFNAPYGNRSAQAQGGVAGIDQLNSENPYSTGTHMAARSRTPASVGSGAAAGVGAAADASPFGDDADSFAGDRHYGNRLAQQMASGGQTIARATGTFQHYGGNEVDDNPLFLPALPTSASVFGVGQQPVLSLSIDQVVGNVVRLSKSHSGSRFVQQKLEECQAAVSAHEAGIATITNADGTTSDLSDVLKSSGEYFNVFFDEMQYNIPELMIDNFAHFSVEKLFTACSDDQLLHLLHQCAPQLPYVACQKHGSFSVQALVDTIRTEQQIQALTDALQNDAVRVVTHASGHFVLLRMLQKFPYQHTKFIDECITNNCAIVGTDHHGLRVIKAVLAIRKPSDLSKLFKQAARLTMKLVENQYGNYFIQALLDVAPPAVRTNIKVKMEGKFMRLSKQKFSSNVVEKCLKQSSSHWRNIIIRELIAQPAVGELLRDRYGNFVIQCSLTVANPQQVQEITQAITPYLHTLRENVKAKWQRLLQKATTGQFYQQQQQQQQQQQGGHHGRGYRGHMQHHQQHGGIQHMPIQHGGMGIGMGMGVGNNPAFGGGYAASGSSGYGGAGSNRSGDFHGTSTPFPSNDGVNEPSSPTGSAVSGPLDPSEAQSPPPQSNTSSSNLTQPPVPQQAHHQSAAQSHPQAQSSHQQRTLHLQLQQGMGGRRAGHRGGYNSMMPLGATPNMYGQQPQQYAYAPQPHANQMMYGQPAAAQYYHPAQAPPHPYQHSPQQQGYVEQQPSHQQYGAASTQGNLTAPPQQDLSQSQMVYPNLRYY